MEDQRRRTLDALKRRFAQAEAEVQTQQQKSKKRPAEVERKVPLPVESLSTDSPGNRPLHKPSIGKGNFSFRGRSSKEDVSDGKIRVDGVLHELFQHGDSAKKYMKGSKSMKIENTILLDNYVQKSSNPSAGRIQPLQQASKRSKKHMSLTQHKKIGSFDLPKEFHNFDRSKPMHEKWKTYVQQLLKIAGKEQLAQCFLNADLHGAIILVVQCKTVTHVGIHGIMVRETKETFGILTQENEFKVVPKKLSVFALQADSWKITLHGDKFVSRNLVP